MKLSDLRTIIREDFKVELSEVSVGRLLKRLGFLHVSARPRHPAQAEDIIDAYSLPYIE
jgi:transposase